MTAGHPRPPPSPSRLDPFKISEIDDEEIISDPVSASLLRPKDTELSSYPIIVRWHAGGAVMAYGQTPQEMNELASRHTHQKFILRMAGGQALDAYPT